LGNMKKNSSLPVEEVQHSRHAVVARSVLELKPWLESKVSFYVKANEIDDNNGYKRGVDQMVMHVCSWPIYLSPEQNLGRFQS
jgi:hypothetical protein